MVLRNPSLHFLPARLLDKRRYPETKFDAPTTAAVCVLRCVRVCVCVLLAVGLSRARAQECDDGSQRETKTLDGGDD